MRLPPSGAPRRAMFAVLVLAGAVALLRSAVGRPSGEEADPGWRVDSAFYGALRAPESTSGSPLDFRRFGQRLFLRRLRATDPREPATLISPVSLGIALSMVAVGARGETFAALAATMGAPDLDSAALVRGSAALLSALRDREDVTLAVANALWADPTLGLSPAYRDEMARVFGATAREVPLASHDAVETVNRWASEATKGKISKALDGPLPDSTRLLLTNVVYFKGQWLEPFEKASTRPRDFTLASRERVRVPMMERSARLGYRRAPGYQMARVPYRSGRAAMYVLLPDSGASVEELAARLEGDGWPASLDRSGAQHVHLVLPRFRAEASAELARDVAALGRGIAFRAGANFGNLARSRALVIGQIRQKVFVEVNEEGTEAAAFTALTTPDSASPPLPIQFVVDRPFLFIIRDEVSGVDLFVGWIANPTK